MSHIKVAWVAVPGAEPQPPVACVGQAATPLIKTKPPPPAHFGLEQRAWVKVLLARSIRTWVPLTRTLHQVRGTSARIDRARVPFTRKPHSALRPTAA